MGPSEVMFVGQVNFINFIDPIRSGRAAIYLQQEALCIVDH